MPLDQNVPSEPDIIGLIYETASQPELWPRLLAVLNHRLDPASMHAHALFQDQDTAASDATPCSPDPSEQGQAISEQLLPHFHRALDINKRLVAGERLQEGLLGILANLPVAVLLLDAETRVCGINPCAQALLDRSDWLQIQDQRLVFRSQRRTRDLEQRVRELIELGEQRVDRLVVDSDPPLSLLLMVDPSSPTTPGQAYCTVFIAPPEHPETNISCDLLQTIFGLSQAEARLARLLGMGNSVNEAADQLHISTHTARSQLKSVFRKTGTNRQSQLVHRILSSPALLLSCPLPGEPPAPRLPALPSPREQDHVLQDGRRLHYAEYGDPDGAPVLFFHSIVGSCLQVLPDRQWVTASGIRWIVPDRPGFGHSDPREGHTFDDMAADMIDLLDELRIETCHVAGYSVGAAGALTLAARYPERVRRLALISPFFPQGKLKNLHGMTASNRMLLALSRHAPALMSPMMRFLLQDLIRNPEKITDRHGDSLPESDRRILERPGMRDYLVEVFRRSVRQGPDAIIAELMLLGRKAGFELDEIQVPTDIWHGDADTHVPESLIQPLRRIPEHRFHRIAGGGHLMLLELGTRIFTRLIHHDS